MKLVYLLCWSVTVGKENLKISNAKTNIRKGMGHTLAAAYTSVDGVLFHWNKLLLLVPLLNPL